ncbi:lipocalin family protein [Pollutibacter soli]|uniref:lipocalin family protein n=1 Tax=Pollutibacter soli TaxID=3034157 RepID=UPI003013380F
MKKFNLKTRALIPALVLIVTLGSCSKDKNPDQDKPKTKKDLIVRAWIQTDLIASVGGLSQSVFDDEIEACAQDNIFTLNSDGTFVLTENTVKCSANDIVTTGTWQLVENDTKVIIDPADEDPQTLTIEELTETSFKGSLVDNSTGMEIKLVGVYQPK